MVETERADLIRLSLGWPSADLYATKELRRACLQAGMSGNRASNVARVNFQEYISYGDFQGAAAFRDGLGRFLSVAYKREVDPDTLFLSAGASAAIDMICTIFARYGDTVLVEAASYHLARRIFHDHGLQVQSMPVLSSGAIAFNALKNLIRKSTRKIALLYLIPTYSNPTSQTLSHCERAQIVALASNYEIKIIADEVYHLLKFPGKPNPPPPLCEFDATGETVLSLGSFTKIAGPGLRLGWIQIARSKADSSLKAMASPFEKIENFGVVRGGGALNHFSSMVVASMLRSSEGLKHLTLIRKKLQSRAESMCESVRTFFPKGAVAFVEPQGGYYLWLGLAPHQRFDMQTFQRIANGRGVEFLPGSTFAASNCDENTKTKRHHVRLSFAFYDDRKIEDAICRLAQAYCETIGKSPEAECGQGKK